jgi:hypothetical protein
MPAAVLAVVPTARGSLTHPGTVVAVRDSEGLLESSGRFIEHCAELLHLLGALSEATVVVEDAPEPAQTIAVVRDGAEHVQVPHLVDEPGRGQARARQQDLEAKPQPIPDQELLALRWSEVLGEGVGAVRRFDEVRAGTQGLVRGDGEGEAVEC